MRKDKGLGKIFEYDNDYLEEILWKMIRRWIRISKMIVNRIECLVSMKKINV